VQSVYWAAFRVLANAVRKNKQLAFDRYKYIVMKMLQEEQQALLRCSEYRASKAQRRYL
jgi:hypothetical protein